MHALTLVALLAVSAAAPDKPPPPPQLKLACPGLSGVKIGDKEATFFSEHLAQQLAVAGATVSSDREISAVLGLERKRQLLGCSESSSQCVTELAGALGVDALVVGDVAKLQNRYQVNVKLISVSTAQLIAAESARADSDEEMVDELTVIAGRLSQRGADKLGRTLIPEIGSAEDPPQPFPTVPVVLTLSGVGIGIAGGYAAIEAESHYKALVAATSEPEALRIKNAGIVWQTVARVGLITGTTLLMTALVSYFAAYNKGRPKVFNVSLTPTGADLTLVWDLP